MARQQPVFTSFPVRRAATWRLLALLVIALAAFVLRALWLARQSFWLDEGFSVALSSGPLSYIVQQSFTVEPNPPFYFLLLHLWRLVAGSSEYAIRFLSLLPAVALVPAVWLIGRRLAPARAALVAAALVAANPYLVWLAQEARMYSWTVLWTTLAAYWLIRAVSSGSRRHWALFAALSLLAVYSHLYAVFVVIAEGVYLLWRALFARQGRTAAWPGVAACLAVGGLFLPWFLSVSAYSGESSTWRGFIGVGDMLRVLGQNFGSQGHLPGNLNDVLAGLLAACALAGAFFAARHLAPGVWRQPAGASPFLLLWLLLPILAVYAVSFKEPLFSPRYFIVVLPALLLLAGAGLAALPAGVSLLGLALLSAGSVWAVERGQLVPAYAKEDYRGAAAYVAQRSEPGDAIGLIANYIVYPFDYYFHGPGKVLPLDVQPDSNLDPLLTPLGQYDHLWLVEAHDVFVDPQDRVGTWLRARYPVEDEKYIIGIHFIEFATHPTVAALPAGARHAALSGGPALAGYQLQSRPGGEMVTLYWASQPHPTEDFHLSLKLWGPNGKLGGQQDGEPLNAGLPFTKFPTSGLIRDEHFIAAPAGSYDLRLSVYPPGQPDAGEADLGQASLSG